MRVTEAGQIIEILGDPHLGRQFFHGVPLNRRGVREARQWADFEASLARAKGADYHVCLGDLFDKWVVSYDLILRVAAAYREAAVLCPGTEFIVLKGNHDIKKDLESASAFDVFAELVAGAVNITVVDDYYEVDDMVFYAWHPTRNVTEFLKASFNTKVAFGHWDTDFADHNMVPTTAGIPKLYTGHVHKPTEFTRHGTKVVVVGSMQPYAHGEEINDDLYVTLTADQVEGAGDLYNKCVRVIGDYAGEIDCLQLTFKSEKETNDDDLPTVSMGDFDMDTLFHQAFKDAGVSAATTERVLGLYHSKRVVDGA